MDIGNEGNSTRAGGKQRTGKGGSPAEAVCGRSLWS